MNALVELIKRIGIFMIAAQAVIHFTPGQKYEKYVRLLVGIIILLQFVVPLRRIISGVETDIGVQLADMEKLFETDDMTGMAGGMTDGMTDQPALAESVMNNLENEIKSKLNNEIAEEDYTVSGVQVSMKAVGEAGNREYVLEKVRVVVYRRTVFPDSQADENADNAWNDRSEAGGETGGTGIEKVTIEKINIGGTSDNGSTQDGSRTAVEGNESDGFHAEDTEEAARRLRSRFCGALGIDEEKMEVSIYGTNEKTDR